jgi:hypothetical protein
MYVCTHVYMYAFMNVRMYVYTTDNYIHIK